MQLNEAQKKGEQVLKQIAQFISRGRLAGSIRRKKPIVKDIDIVIELKPNHLEDLKESLAKLGEFKLKGDKAIRLLTSDNIQIDLYVGNKDNYESLLLIRTGSKEHNVKLTTRSHIFNYKLTANGLIDIKTDSIIATSERDIFKALKMDYVEPEKRN